MNNPSAERGLPTGRVTFLFTDIQGSTQLWEKHPEEMKSALAEHDSILREAIETNRGYVIKTTGDGFHAVFATVVDAVHATITALLADSEASLLRDKTALWWNSYSSRDFSAQIASADYRKLPKYFHRYFENVAP